MGLAQESSLVARGVIVEPVYDLAAIREEWALLAERGGNVFGTWEWAEAWHRHLAPAQLLQVAIARDADRQPAAVLPLYAVRTRPLRLLRFLGAGQADELGPVCAPSDTELAAEALRRFVLERLRDGGLFLGDRMWNEPPLIDSLGAVRIRRAPSPVLATLGRSFDEYLGSRSRNFREQVRRRERQLARDRRLVYRLTETPDQLEGDMRTLIRLHAARWGRQGSRVFARARGSFHREFARHALEQGWLRLWIMELDGRPVAAWYGFRYAGVETYYQGGRDPAFDALSVGFVLMCHTIRCAFEDGMREYRFGLGDEPYKHRFTDEDRGLETAVVSVGPQGKAGLMALRGVLRLPEPVRRLAPRLI